MIYKKTSDSEEQNFWISYADLMAGLLFVFILLIGAIVIKYVFIQTDLQAIRSDLQKEKEALGLSEEALAKKKKILEEIKSKLKKARQENFHLTFELGKMKELQEATKEALQKSKANREKLARAIKAQKENIATKIEEIGLKTEEITKLKSLLLDYELKEKELQDKNRILTEKLDQNSYMIELKDEEIAKLEQKLLENLKAHQKLVEELNITKVKIKNLTGIRIKVASKLKDTLGKSIQIDPKSGAIRFSSNILFNQSEYILKEEAKKELSTVLKKYISTLLSDKQIRGYIDHITIEGHTNSDGDYMYNLELSQKRALEVMKFLYSLDIKNKNLFSKYLSASGRSYSDLIYKNGKEDKDASRRIEIKFRIKNEQAIKELESFLNK